MPQHDKTNMDSVPREDLDQPGHPPSLIRAFTVRSMVDKDPRFLHADSEDSVQTGWMPRRSESSLGVQVILLVSSCCGSIILSNEVEELR